MTDYQKLYYFLFNAITDALTYLDNGDLCCAKEVLIAAQQKSEEVYIESE